MKRLACWIGRHKWELRIDHGDEFKVCAVCGRSPRPRRTGPSLNDSPFMKSGGGP